MKLYDRAELLNIIKLCGKEKDLLKASKMHASFLKEGLLAKDGYIATALITTYAKCGALEKGREVFEQLPSRNIASWNSLISGYVLNGLGDEAVKCFRHMQDMGVRPDKITYVCTLKACGIVGSLDIVEDIYAEVRMQGSHWQDVLLGNTLVDVYSKCGVMEKAQEVFDRILERDVVSWNSLITGFVKHGLGDEALKCFWQMQDAGICPDRVTYICILKACGISGQLEIGEEIYAYVRAQGLLLKDVVLGTALVDMYSKCGMLKKAKEVFDQIPIPNVVSWSALITGYVQHGLGDDALECFRQMQDMGVYPDIVSYICILKSCGMIGSLDIGEDINGRIQMQGFSEKDVMVGVALIDMYSKCGALEKAREIFERLPVQNVVSWSALIAGYAQFGQTELVFKLSKRMQVAGVVPSLVTFVVLLTSCSHAGLLKEGENLFHEMCAVNYYTPMREHYTCMIDLFGRAGQVDKVLSLLNKVSLHSGKLPLFLNILGACRKWGKANIGRWVFEQLMRLDEISAAGYIDMENIYAAVEETREDCS